jgi:hypothetical protein
VKNTTIAVTQGITMLTKKLAKIQKDEDMSKYTYVKKYMILSVNNLAEKDAQLLLRIRQISSEFL